jgi:hypothetical protein
VVELELASDRPLAMVAVRLNDVRPDGAVTRVTYGLLNLAHRKSHEFPEPLTPGRRERVRVQLNDIGQAFETGHRLRIAISTAYWPIAWPSPEPVTLTVFTGASTLDLPLREPDPAADAQASPPPGAQPPPLKTTTLVPGGERRSITRDVTTGETIVEIGDDAGTRIFDEIGLEYQAAAVGRYAIRPEDPLSAKAEVGWDVGMARGDWRIRTRTFTRMTCTKTEFKLHATLDAYEGQPATETRVFSKEWNTSIPRDHV